MLLYNTSISCFALLYTCAFIKLVLHFDCPLLTTHYIFRPKDFTLENAPENMLRAAKDAAAPYIAAIHNLRQDLRKVINAQNGKDDIAGAYRAIKTYRQGVVQDITARRKIAVCTMKSVKSESGAYHSAAVEAVVVAKLTLELFRADCQMHRKRLMENKEFKKENEKDLTSNTLSKEDSLMQGIFACI